MTNKCAHPGCSCTVPEGKMYCSDKCATGNPRGRTRPPQARQDAPLPDANCGCGHPGCKGR
jgi:hypothetical protein